MQEFVIPVRNEFTGEVRVLTVTSTYEVDAQIEALRLLFRCEGWTKARALVPEKVPESA